MLTGFKLLTCILTSTVLVEEKIVYKARNPDLNACAGPDAWADQGELCTEGGKEASEGVLASYVSMEEIFPFSTFQYE